jgi:hypothetical protein
MRHRYVLSLYDESPVDADILDYLAEYPSAKRQEILRGIIRAGFSTLIQHKNTSEAVIDSLDSNVTSLLLQILTNNNRSEINSSSVAKSERFGREERSKAKDVVSDSANNSLRTGNSIDKGDENPTLNHEQHKPRSSENNSQKHQPVHDRIAEIIKASEETVVSDTSSELVVDKSIGKIDDVFGIDDDIDDPMSKLLLFVND